MVKSTKVLRKREVKESKNRKAIKVFEKDRQQPSGIDLSKPSKPTRNLSSLFSMVYPGGISGSSNRRSFDHNDENEISNNDEDTGELMDHDESEIATSAKVPFVPPLNITTPSPGQHPITLPFSREK